LSPTDGMTSLVVCSSLHTGTAGLRGRHDCGTFLGLDGPQRHLVPKSLKPKKRTSALAVGIVAGAAAAVGCTSARRSRDAFHQTVVTATAAKQAVLIDGKKLSADVRKEVKDAVAWLQHKHGLTPGLAVVIVGSRKDSATYVRNKKKAAEEVGFHSIDVSLSDDISEEELVLEISKLNDDPAVHAILVQLPLPSHIDETRVLATIQVDKDADGFSVVNIGRLCLSGSQPLAIPCTPAGCIEMLQRSGVVVSGADVVVLGRSNIVGMPLAAMLQSSNATVTVCHSFTKNLREKVRQADIVVAAMGKAEMVRGDWLKPGCVVIDVGINAVEDNTRKLGYRLVGDVCFDEAKRVASMITPVPGGVGPMTVAMLLKNTLELARNSLGLSRTGSEMLVQ